MSPRPYEMGRRRDAVDGDCTRRLRGLSLAAERPIPEAAPTILALLHAALGA